MKGYGMTEVAGPFCSSTHFCTQMIPFPESEVMICDTQTAKELTYGQVGEICVSGTTLMDGYLDSPDDESDVIFEEDGRRWMRTGDLGRINEDGHFEMLGRFKRLLWAVGDDGIPLRVYPMEIEGILEKHPSISKCAVVGTQHENGYEIVAFVVPEKGVHCSDMDEQLLAHCESLLPTHAVPRRLAFMDSLPLTPIGKVDFQALEELV